MRQSTMFAGVFCAVMLTSHVLAQQIITGKDLALKSSGEPAWWRGDGDWVMWTNGYLGTYIHLDQPGQVTLTLQAGDENNTSGGPHVNVAVGDASQGFDILTANQTAYNDYSSTFDLPAGTHLVRMEFTNDSPSSDLRVRQLSVSGADVLNSHTDANAIAAANTYIENYRKGPAHVTIAGASAGDTVHVKLRSHAFNFGTAVGGTTEQGINSYLENPQYSQFLLDHFNTIVPGNAGKWSYQEAERDVITMQGVERLLDYAAENGLRTRMHTMLWDTNQQPGWASSLLSQAQGSAAAKAELREEISERIAYYVQQQADRYAELDVLNESLHQERYWEAFGAAGIADIFNETAQAVRDSGGDAKLYLNEYNVLQFSSNPLGGGSDLYANWYRGHVSDILNAGGDVGGIGVQYYVDGREEIGGNVHSAARIMQVLQNLSVTGLPISLTEFGVKADNDQSDGDHWDANDAADYLEDTMRIVFGTPNATTFMMWGFWVNDVWGEAPLAALVDENFNLTPVGERYEQLMAEWDTDLELVAGEDGKIDFTGFYGQYDVLINGEVLKLDLTAGVTDYQLHLAPEPGSASLVGLMVLAPFVRRRCGGTR